MNLSEFWIGDYVLIVSQNLRGRFEGMAHEDLAKVRISGNLILVPASDLEACEDPIEEVLISLFDDDSDRSIKTIKPKLLKTQP